MTDRFNACNDCACSFADIRRASGCPNTVASRAADICCNGNCNQGRNCPLVSRPAELDDGTPVEHRTAHGAGIVFAAGITLACVLFWLALAGWPV